MIYELQADYYRNILSLVHKDYISVQLQTVLEGNSPGVVFTEPGDSPETALVFHQGEAGFYFIGNPGNTGFLKEIVPYIQTVIPVRLQDNQLDEFEFCGDSIEWNSVFRQIFSATHIWESTQYVHLRQGPKTVPHYAPPEGISLRRIDKQLYADAGVVNRKPLCDTVNQWWHSWDDFIEQGGGFIALKHQEIVGWCILGGKSQSMYAIDIATDETHRRQGIASALASAMVGWITHAGNIPYWECMASNTASAKLAKKCGLHLELTYQLFGCEFKKLISGTDVR